MAKNLVTTTLVVAFVDPDQAAKDNLFLSAEIDNRDPPDGLNDGNTQFIIGDSPAYLVFKSEDLLITQVTTGGSIAAAGSGIQVKQVEIVSFAKSRDATLSKPAVDDAVDFIHIGGDVATIKVQGNKLSVPQKIIAVFQATYFAEADAFRLTGVTAVAGVPEVAVVVYIEGQNAVET